MIRCEDVLREISNYIDGEVSVDLRTGIEEHLRGCHGCTVLVGTTQKMLVLVAGNYVLPLPAGVSERLLERLALLER